MIARQYYSCNEMRWEGLTVFDPPPSIELILPMTLEDLPGVSLSLPMCRTEGQLHHLSCVPSHARG